MQGGQEPQRPRGDGGPGRGVYLARRIAAVLVVLVLLALLVPRACQAFSGSEEEPRSEASQDTEVGGAGRGEEDSATTQGGAGASSEAVDAMTVVERPVPTGGEEASRAESGGAPSIEVAASPARMVAGPEVLPGNIGSNTPSQTAQTSNTAQPNTGPVSNVFTGNQQQIAQTTTFGEMIPTLGSVAFGERIAFGGESPFGEDTCFEETVFEDQGSSGDTIARAGSVVAVA